MPSFRDFIDPGGRLLARRLDELCSHLEDLSVRLRGTIANAIGETIGGVIRDAALGVISTLSGCIPGVAKPSSDFRQQHAYARDDRYPHEPDGYWHDDWEPEAIASDLDDEPHQTRNRRMPTAISAGLLAAAFWLRRSAHVCPIVTTCSIGLIATGIAYLGGPLAVALVDLATSAGLVPSVSQAITGRLMFGWLNSA